MRAKIIGAALAAATFCGAPHAGEFDGNALLRWMNGDKGMQFAALAYVSGVSDSLDAIAAIELMRRIAYPINGAGNDVVMDSTACFPEGATRQQAYDVVKKRLVDAPQDRHKPAIGIVMSSLRDAWPCLAPQ